MYRRVLVLVNPRSGLHWSFNALRRAVTASWEQGGVKAEVLYQFCHDAQDGTAKARRAVDLGFDTVLVCGGDGTVSSVGRGLIGSDVALAVIPLGSGNGFARHFNIPLSPGQAVKALATGRVRRIDVGVADGRPFLVTCSMAWDAAIVRSFEKSPIRGIVPYIFAGVYEFLEYEPQSMVVHLDEGEKVVFPDPIFFTIANLTQYGGGARIAPNAEPDDGMLELVTASRQDSAFLLANAVRFFNGTLDSIPKVTTHRFRSLTVRRERDAPIQLDGELVDAPVELTVEVRPRALSVVVPC